MSRINLGIISFAHGHVGVYCNQMRNWDDVRLVSAWDDNAERGRKNAESFGMEYSPHLDDLLGRRDIDAVIVTGPSAWHIDPVANKGMFMDDAVHAADFLYWLLGEPVSVMAEIDNVLTTCAPDDTGMAVYRFREGAFGLLYNCSVTLGAEI